MHEYRLSELAAQDLFDIALYGMEHFGLEASFNYRDMLKERLERVAEHPERYPLVEHIRRGYRRTVCGVHSIYYRIEADEVVIIRILGRQDPGRAL